jgi:hypothetical protein
MMIDILPQLSLAAPWNGNTHIDLKLRLGANALPVISRGLGTVHRMVLFGAASRESSPAEHEGMRKRTKKLAQGQRAERRFLLGVVHQRAQVSRKDARQRRCPG